MDSNSSSSSSNNSNERRCGTCNGETVLRTSNTPKNPNRQFYSCADGNCGKFNGWADEAQRSGFRAAGAGRSTRQNDGDASSMQSQFDQLRGIVTNMRLQIGQLSGNMDEMATEIMALRMRLTEMS